MVNESLKHLYGAYKYLTIEKAGKRKRVKYAMSSYFIKWRVEHLRRNNDDYNVHSFYSGEGDCEDICHYNDNDVLKFLGFEDWEIIDE